MSLLHYCPIPHRCTSEETDFIVYLLEFVGIGYLDRSIFNSPTHHKVSQLHPSFSYTETVKNSFGRPLMVMMMMMIMRQSPLFQSGDACTS